MKRIVILGFLISIAVSLDIKGINFVSMPYTRAKYSTKAAKETIKNIKSTGSNWISVPVPLFQESTDSSDMKPIYAMLSTFDRFDETPDEREINYAVTMAKNNGLKVMLMPTIEVNRPGFIKSNLIGEEFAPYQARRWFKFYQEELLKIAKIAEENGTDMICIGHNLKHLSYYERHWDELIKAVREVYSGKLTYSASLDIEFLKSGFWKKLDYVGLIADFELEISKDTQKEHVAEKLNELIKVSKYMHKVWKKEVLITRASIHPAHELNEENKVVRIHHGSQANYYRGILEGIKSYKHINGVFFGDWIPDPNFGGEKDVSLSPQNKEGELVLREFYGGEKEFRKVDPHSVEKVEEPHKMYCQNCYGISDIDL